MRLNARDIALFSILISLSLALSFFETLLPVSFFPLPGIKLGLANIILLYVLYVMSPKSCIIILLCRCILASLFGGGISSFAFSLCGGLFSIVTMYFFKRSTFFSIYGVSIAGAAAHGFGQILAAGFMMASISVIYYLPFLLFASLFTGLITAFLASVMISRIKFVYKK